MTEHAVVIAGGGPTGVMLATELALAGVDAAIVEPLASREAYYGSRAGGLHARTLEILDQRGIVDRFLAEGKPMQTLHFGTTVLDLGNFPTRHNYGLALWQNHSERLLAAWADELGVKMYRGVEVRGFTEDGSGVTVALSNGQSLRAQYLVGCDGGRSIVRKTAGIDFPGWDASVSWLIAEVETTEEPKVGWHTDARGALHAMGKSDKGGARMVLEERGVGTSDERRLDDLHALLVDAYGTDFGAHSASWISRFTDATRQAASYRKGRILLAGDAANIRAPLGGQGLNLGVYDAVNLGWKLAQVVNGVSPDALLDTYHAERHPAVARVLRNTMAQVALRPTNERMTALKEAIAGMLRHDAPRNELAGLLSGLDVHYDFGPGHPLLGRRMPDLDIATERGAVRAFELLHTARPLLLNFGAPRALDSTPRPDRVQLVDATYSGAWRLPVIGEVDAPSAVLVRPDGYVAWVSNADGASLGTALSRWFGADARPQSKRRGSRI